MKYDLLSKGQKAFLSTVFKLGILMQQEKSGLIILDDGLNDLDETNFGNLIQIIKTLPFQAICVYQGYNILIEGTKHFTAIRQNGESKIQ
jgi:recombinational DNA repair ATPase RecF